MINRSVGVLMIMLLLSACGGDEEGYIPNVPVNYTVTVQEFNIKAVNRVLIVPSQGVAGLMIVGIGNTYVTFDRLSSVSPENGCKVSPDESGITATDPCTGAKYLLTDGSPQKAPAVRSLKIYNTALQNGQVIHITN
jgi:hypothetical protein